jgi:hypothetical protein
MAMSQPRRKLFGPLRYSTLLAAVLVSIFAGVQLGKPRLDGWLRRHRLAAMMHNSRTRLVMDLLADAVGSVNEEVRLKAARLLGRVSFYLADGKAITKGTEKVPHKLHGTVRASGRERVARGWVGHALGAGVARSAGKGHQAKSRARGEAGRARALDHLALICVADRHVMAAAGDAIRSCDCISRPFPG